MPVGQDGGTLSDHGPRAGAGNNHGRAGRAMRVVALLLGLFLVPWTGPALAQGLVQRNVPAEATAENAVVARDRALAAGQRIAYERMAEELGLPREVSDQQIERQVASLVIESERVTARSYTARITVNFRAPGSGGGSRSSGVQPNASPVASIEATARFGSIGEYAEFVRRLAASPAVARAELMSVSARHARWRIALRVQPEAAPTELATAGLSLGEGDPREGWRLGLGAR